MRSRRSSTRCRARARTPGGRPSSAASPAATCGRGARRTGRAPCARSATPTSSARTALAAASSRAPPSSPTRSRRTGRAPPAPSAFVVCTGGEPLLQLDSPLVARTPRSRLRDRHRDERHDAGRRRPRLDLRQPEGGRAAAAHLRRRAEAGLPAAGRRTGGVRGLHFRTSCCSRWTARTRQRNTALAIAYCLAHPRWRLSLQTHKLTGIR